MNNRLKNKTKRISLKGSLAVSFLYITYWLPNWFTRKLGRITGILLFKLSAKRRNIILTNLEIAFPELNQSETNALAYKISEQSGLLLSEVPSAWFSSQKQIEKKILKVNNAELIEKNLALKQTIIVAIPHIGNWEFLTQWIQINFPMTGLYSPSKVAQIDRLILTARSKFGGYPYPANSKGILKLLRKLKQGGLMVILPDQSPKEGGGTYTPFFGYPAYTMTLLHRFVKKTGAKVVFAHCIRSNDTSGYDISFETSEFDIEEENVEIFNLGMNQQIEKIVRQNPTQYVWDYQRFKRQPDGKNLYKEKIKERLKKR